MLVFVNSLSIKEIKRNFFFFLCWYVQVFQFASTSLLGRGWKIDSIAWLFSAEGIEVTNLIETVCLIPPQL